MSNHFVLDLIKQNRIQILILGIVNFLAVCVVISQVSSQTADNYRDVLTVSSVLLGITTATIVFFGQYVETTTDDLFKKRENLKQFKDVPENLSKALLSLIVLQYFLWWSLITDGIATLLSLTAFYIKNTPMIGVLSLSFLVMGIVTLLVWMSMFVISNTPGKSTYDALKEDQTDAKKS